jgi:disulfide oxidoreductase YuzD
MSMKMKIKWRNAPQKKDYAAAESYLTLHFEPAAAKKIVQTLEAAEKSEFAAKDIFRASELPLLSDRDSHVEMDRAKIIMGEEMTPILLVRTNGNGKVIIADGYHRICAVYMFDQDASIPCKIV